MKLPEWEQIVTNVEKMGGKVANGAHKVIITGMLAFIAYQLWNFNRPIEY